MSAEIHKVIENSRLFSGLEPGLVQTIAASAHRKSLGTHQCLFKKGDPANALWGVLSGRIAIKVSTDDGKEMVLDIFKPGDVFGEVGVLDFGPHRADAIAETSSVLFRIDRQHLLQYLQNSPELCFRIFTLLCADLRETTELLEDTALYTLPGRLARRLVLLADEDAQENSQGHILLNISQFELARLLGVHRSTVNRQLRDWEKRGWLILKRERIELVDRESLMSIVSLGWKQNYSKSGRDLENHAAWPTSGFIAEDNIEPGQGEIERRVAAVMAVDAADYSKLLMTDAAGTLERLRAGLRSIDTVVLGGGGRTVSHTGDRVLAEFPSADRAVRAALAIHHRSRGSNLSREREGPSMFRIGVHYAEILAGGGEYLGEAVNVAIHLTRLSMPGSVCFSEQVLDKLESTKTMDIQFLGAHALKSVAGVVSVYSAHPMPFLRRARLRLQTLVPRRFRFASIAGSVIVAGLALWLAGERFGINRLAATLIPPRSIAVLPLESVGDSGHTYLADGLTQEIRSSLRALDELQVTGAISSNYFKNKNSTPLEIGDDLQVAWLLQGSADWTGESLAIDLWLTNTSTGEIAWQHDFRGGWEDIGELKRTITGAMDTHLLGGNGLARSVVASPLLTVNQKAYALYAQATQFIIQGGCKNRVKAVPLLEQAVELDPGFGEAWARLSRSYEHDCRDIRQAGASPKQRSDAAFARALEFAPNSPLVLARASERQFIKTGDIESANRLVLQALDTDPNNPEALQVLARISFMKDDWLAVNRIGERLLQLDPLDIRNVQAYVISHWLKGDWNEVLAVAKKARTYFPDKLTPFSWMAKSLWKTGDYNQALEMQQLARPVGVPLDLWIGLKNDEVYLANESSESSAPLTYLGYFELVRQRLIDQREEVKDDYPQGNLLELGELEALAGNFSASMAYFELVLDLSAESSFGFSNCQRTSWTGVSVVRQSMSCLALMHTYRNTGQDLKARDIASVIEQFIEHERRLYRSVGGQAEQAHLYAEAQLRALEGRTRQALEVLRRWQATSTDIFTYVRIDPFLESLHNEPEFWSVVADVEAELAGIRAQWHARQAALEKGGT